MPSLADPASPTPTVSNNNGVFAIINPVSCPLGVDAMKTEITDSLLKRGIACSFMETCESETALPLARKAMSQGAQLIIAAGGDGTIMEAINAVRGTETPVGIVPAGTGNLLAANLNIPTAVDDAVDVAVNGDTMRLDLVSIDDGKKHFAIMGGLGYDAEIMRDTPREFKSKIGKLAYLITGMRALEGKRFGVQVTLDDSRTITTRAKSLLIANMGQLVKGVNLFPDANPIDGTIHVGILKASSWRTFLHLVYDTLRGKPFENPHFDLYSARRVTVRCRRPVPFELDGDDMGDVLTLTAEVVPQAARVRVPKSSTV